MAGEDALTGVPTVRQLLSVLRSTGGDDLARYDEEFLSSVLAKRTVALGLGGVDAYVEHLAVDRAERARLLDELRISFSEFFRNPLTFALLEQQVLPLLVHAEDRDGGSGLRIWSAGCAAGQEALSVAMLLEDLGAARARPIAYKIFATDVSPLELATAARGVYSHAAVRNVRTRHLETYFTPHGDGYAIVPRLLERVDYSLFDLLDEQRPSPPASLYGDFNMILCCNVLFYFRSAMRTRILTRLCAALAPGGFLITGEAERDSVAAHPALRAVPAHAGLFQLRSTP